MKSSSFCFYYLPIGKQSTRRPPLSLQLYLTILFFEMYRNKLAVTQELMSKSLELYEETHRHHPVRRPDSLLKTHFEPTQVSSISYQVKNEEIQ